MPVPPDSNHGAGWLPGNFMTNNCADSSTRWLVNCEEDLTALPTTTAPISYAHT